MQELVLAGRDSYLDETLANFEFQMAEAAAGILTVAKTDQNNAAVLSALFEKTLTVPVKNLVGILDTTPEFASVVFIDSLNTLTAEIFDFPLYDPVLAFATSSPTSTFTVTFTPTQGFTATFTATNSPTPEPTSAEEEVTSIPPTHTPFPTSPPQSTNTPQPPDNPPPPPTETIEPTSAPTPTNPPTATQAPPPTDSPEPAPDKTKKPKPTQHPTYRPTATQGN